MRMKDKMLAFFREEEGLTAVEYAVGGALVAAGLVAAFVALRTQIIAEINLIIAALQSG
jgi:pilus assembly protein Flp/PilA